MVMLLTVAFIAFQACRLVLGDRLSVSTANLTNSTNTAAKHIRIAFIHHNHMPFTPMKHFISHFGAAGNRTILPDYEITIDSFPIEPDRELTPVAVVKILDANTPTYSAIAGPNSRADTLAMVNVVAEARMLHAHKAGSAILSNRTLYPYTFRALRAMQGVLSIWFHLSSFNGWSAAASVWTEADTFEYSIGLASSLNITNYATLVERGQAAWAVEAWQAGLVDLIRSTRLRIVMLYVEVDVGWQLACKLFHEQLSGLQFFTPPFAGWVNGWFLREDFDPSLGTCTPDEIYSTVAGHLYAIHVPGSPGLNFLGAVYLPPVGGDYSQLPLTCTPQLTAHEWYNSNDHLMMAVSDGTVTDLQSAIAYFSEAGSEQDQICQILLAIHDVIYVKGYSVESIESREEAAFEALVASMQEVEFLGPTGPFRFYKNTPDPEYVYHTISQLALPGISNASQPLHAAVTWPDGPAGKPVIQQLHGLYPVDPLRWRDGSTGIGPNEAGLYPDCGAVNSELKWEKCEPCPPGTSFDPELNRCRTCSAGEYQNESAAASCIVTSPGFYSATVGAVQPSPCPSGHECPQAGMTQPQPCAKGRFATRVGQASCNLCPVGTYREEEAGEECSTCEVILAGSVTRNLASESPADCICPEGRYRPPGNTSESYIVCLPCLEGMMCPEGSDMRNLDYYEVASQDLAVDSPEASRLLSIYPFPLAKRGYMTRLSQPLQVFLCAEEHQCPGGPPGSCDRYRDSSTRACGDCENDAYEAGDDCEPCGEASVVPFIIAGVAATAVVIVGTLLVNRDVHKAPAASMMIVATTGLMFTSVQSMGVFSQMAVVWMEPIKSALELTRLLSFDLRILKVVCIMGINPVRSFALRQTPALAAIPFMALTLLVKKYARPHAKEQIRVSVELTNAIGTLFSVFFISIVISAMDPFICYEHPGDSGESVRSAPSLLCFQGGEHTNMMIIGILAMCVIPAPFVALCGYATIVYASSMASNNGRKFLHAFRFLFFRYVPQCYYFQIFVFLKSLGICLAPVVFRGQASTQVLFMCGVLAVYILLVQFLNPWRCKPCTPVDAAMTMLLLIMLVCGALFIEDTPQEDAVSILAIGIVFALFGGGLVVVIYAVWQRLTPRPYYHYFVCHHKAHAAAQARLLKTLLQRKRRTVQVFIDSDDLQELDTLFDIVKSRVGHLLVYLTADTLKRPWCAGEIVTALRARLLITRLQTPSFAAPSDEQLKGPNHYLDTSGCNLSEYGIGWDDISAAFKQFLGPEIPQIDLCERFPGTRRFDQLAAAVLKQSSGEARVPALAEIRAGCVFVATYADSDEANASAGILVSRISENVFRVCEEGLFILSDFKPDIQHMLRITQTASVGVVMLTAGCLRSLEQISVICELMQLQGSSPAPGVISVSTPGFEFPAPAQIEKLCEDLPALNVVYGGLAAEHVKAFFKRISIVLPTHASQQALNTQGDEVFHRIEGFLRSKKMQLSSDESSSRNVRAISPAPSARSAGLLQKGVLDNNSCQKDHVDPEMITILANNRDNSRLELPESGYTWTLDLSS